MLQLKSGMHKPLEKKGPAERGVNEQKTQPEEAGFSSVSHSRKYSLIQDQARELTHLRQKMRIGGAISSLLIQHVKNTVKTFEELLRSNSIDYYMEQHFREQLAKGSQLAESLASKFSTDDCMSKKNQTGQTLRNLSILREMHKKGKVMEVLETKQDARPQTWPQTRSSSHAQPAAHRPPSSTSRLLDVSPATPADSALLHSNHSEAVSAQPFSPLSAATQPSGTPDPGLHGSSGPWDEMRPQKMNASGNLSSSSSLYRPDSKPSGAALLEKNLVEIQNLRQRLEESVFVNDRLRERLEHVLSNADQGKDTAPSPPGVSLAHTQRHSSSSDQVIF
ncbi:myomegalin isoform X2 [Camelus ferus]|uniref:Myomegalin isoform X2 n=1 Tax=Camelus ferus TaxID=419612 RepID=A0A8B8RQQ6_CAMFR|nr:myomegalin isoform X2 [Camelus ferus]